jgi:NADH-quinone oxidoreductase subunit N
MLPVADLLPFLGPVLALVLGALATLLAEPFLSRADKHKVLPWIGLGATALSGVCLFFTRSGALLDTLAIDPQRAGLLAVLLGVLALALTALQRNLTLEDFPGGEPYVLLQLAAVGIMLMVLSAQTIALFLGMELASLSIYPLVGLRRRDPASAEAVLKYFAQGAAFSAVFLLGAALSYGATGTVHFAGWVLPGREAIAFLGFALMTIGLLFKLGLAPFHFWSPDAYAGAPSGVAAFMSGAVKIGAVGALANLWIGFLLSISAFPMFLLGHRPPLVGDHFAPLNSATGITGQMLGSIFQVHPSLTIPGFVGFALLLFGATAVLSIVVGSFSLLGQTSVRRLVAFSGVANAGFLALGFLLPGLFFGNIQMEATYFYLAVYALGAAGLLTGLAALSGPEDVADDLASLAGTARKHPLVGLAVTVLLASLAGLPPTAGFLAKFQILSGLFLNSQILPGMERILPAVVVAHRWILLAVPVGAFLLAIVAAAGYFRLAVVLWSEPGTRTREPEPLPGVLTWLLGLSALAVVVLAALPKSLFGG